VTKSARAVKAKALLMRVVCNEEGDGDIGKSDGNKGGRQATVTRAMATAMATTWAIPMAMRWAGNKEGKGKDSKGNGNIDKGGGQATATATKRAMAMAMRVVDKQHRQQQRGQ
jgi:hypothetical protein